jgi:serine/threonine protein kinase
MKILGCGAFGKVLEVLDHKYNRHYALKILKVSD